MPTDLDNLANTIKGLRAELYAGRKQRHAMMKQFTALIRVLRELRKAVKDIARR